MSRKLILLTSLILLLAKSSSATIIVIVGTGDGLLLCEDRRLTSRSSNGQISFSEADKAQQIGKYGFFAVTGDVSGTVTNFWGQRIRTFDILSGIPSFFGSHNIQQFDEQTALEFESHLRDQLSKKPATPVETSTRPKAQTEVLLYWMDQVGQAHLYVVDMTSTLDSGSSAQPRLVGRFISPASFRTSRPVVRGRGALGYEAIASGANPALYDLRKDEELRPFLTDFQDASSTDSIAAARALKKLIRAISERQNSISPDGLDVGPISDCFLGTLDGIKNINQ